MNQDQNECSPELTDEDLDQAAGGAIGELTSGMDSQTQKVTVRSWDPVKKKAIVGEAEDG